MKQKMQAQIHEIVSKLSDEHFVEIKRMKEEVNLTAKDNTKLALDFRET